MSKKPLQVLFSDSEFSDLVKLAQWYSSDSGFKISKGEIIRKLVHDDYENKCKKKKVKE